MRFYRASAAGGETQIYTLALANARTTGIRLEMLNNSYPDLAGLRDCEKVSLVYESITATWMDGGIEYEDRWAVPVV